MMGKTKQDNFDGRIIKYLLKHFWCYLLLSLFILNIDFALSDQVMDKTILNKAAVLLQQKKPRLAYALLEKYEDEYAGWWEYDYLLGISALESDKANLAIFALQRSLAMNPDLVGAHVDLGKAYFKVNELRPAKLEFETVLKNQPIKKVRNVAKKYLQLINNKSNPIRLSSRFYLESVGGYDSNANSATDEKTFNGFALSDENTRTASSYFSLKAGASMFMKLNKKNSFNLAANISQRENQNIENVDFTNSNIQTVWNYRHRFAEQAIGINFSKTNISENFQTYSTAMNFSLKFKLIVGAKFGLNGGITNLNYSGTQSVKNSVQTMIGVSLSKKNGKFYIPSTTLSSFIGEIIPRGSQRSSGKKIYGGRVGLRQRFKAKIPIFISLSSGLLYSSYNEKQIMKNRSDMLADLSLSTSIKFRKSWETSVKIAYTKNESNIELYSYSRMNNSLSLRRYF